MDSQFYAVTHKLAIHFFLFPHRQNNSCPFTRTLILYKGVTFLQTLTITFLFREVPVKLFTAPIAGLFAYTFAPKYTGAYV